MPIPAVREIYLCPTMGLMGPLSREVCVVIRPEGRENLRFEVQLVGAVAPACLVRGAAWCCLCWVFGFWGECIQSGPLPRAPGPCRTSRHLMAPPPCPAQRVQQVQSKSRHVPFLACQSCLALPGPVVQSCSPGPVLAI